jgi:coatomer subunit gamma
MPDTILEQVSVIMQPPDDSGLAEDFIIPVPSLSSANSPGVVYVSFTRDAPEEYVTASFQCGLKFISKEVDPATGEPEADGYEDEYQLEEVELAAGGDYIIPSYSNFASEWDRLRTGASITETFTLSSMESIKGTASFFFGFLSPALTCHCQLPAILLSSYSRWSLWAGPKTLLRERQFIHYNCLVC